MIFVIIMSIIAIILIIILFNIANSQRNKEFEEKLKYFNKKH